jgi:DNA-binding transcriptional MocR family regulator
MKPYKELSREELLACKEELDKQYKEAQGKGLNLNMSRGKPEKGQLDMGMGLMSVLGADCDMKSEDGTDCRNYGELDGIMEAKVLMAGIMGVRNPEDVILFGNGSLSTMYDAVCRSFVKGVLGSTPWCKLDHVKFLCPVPGYDRHFAITEHFGIEMINIPMTATGPDMDLVEQYVTQDPMVKGIWCVPKYSNPQGISYSDETVKRFAALEPAAEDFRIYWDNAYAVHHLYEDDQDEILDILEECEKAGHPDMVYIFGSTSKISMAGAGIAAMAASRKNMDSIKKSIAIRTICYDKINQLRHARYFNSMEAVREHMKKHADILRPKFEAVLDVLEQELGGLGIGSWVKPKGGYFITFEAMEGCAGNIVKKCKEAGVTLTNAGAPFPYGKDPHDSVIRIAPSFPSPDELAAATDLFVLCVKLASLEKLLEASGGKNE